MFVVSTNYLSQYFVLVIEKKNCSRFEITMENPVPLVAFALLLHICLSFALIENEPCLIPPYAHVISPWIAGQLIKILVLLHFPHGFYDTFPNWIITFPVLQ